MLPNRSIEDLEVMADIERDRHEEWVTMNQTRDKVCPLCGDRPTPVEINCQGRQKRGEIPLVVMNCRCLHPGDLICNCGNPCRSFF